MAASLALPRSWSVFLGINYFRSLIERRQLTHTCPDCGAEVSPNFKTLKRTGHHRARVYYARLALERRLMELYARVPIASRPARNWRMQDRITALFRAGILSKAHARRAAKRWSQCSKVCHGGTCDVISADRLVRTTNRLLNELHEHNLSTVAGAV